MKNVEKFVLEQGHHRGEEIPGFREFVVPVADKIFEASKHLTPGALTRYAFTPGVNLIGATRSGLVAAIARRLCGVPKPPAGGSVGSAVPAASKELESLCRELRLDRTRGIDSQPAPIEEDREHIKARLETGEADAWTSDTLRRALDILDKWIPVSIVVFSKDEAESLLDVLDCEGDWADGLIRQLKKHLKKEVVAT